MNPLKRALVNMLVLIVSAGLAVFLLEVAIRLVVPQKLLTPYYTIWRPDPVFGWRHQENIATVINSGEGRVHFVTDAQGFRVNQIHEPEDQHDFERHVTILFLGDSFLEAIQVENQATIPQLLKHALTRNPDLWVSVTNAGVGGWNPNQYLLEAQRLAANHYDLALVFLYVANDIICHKVERFAPQEKHVHRFRWPRRVTFQEITAALLYPVNERLERSSHLYVLVKNRTTWIRMRLGLAAEYFPRVFLTNMRASPCWPTTLEVCQAIHATFRPSGTSTVFVLLPSSIRTHPHLCQAYLRAFDIHPDAVDPEQPNSIVRPLFESAGLRLSDPLAYMRARAQTDGELYGRVDAHLNAAGHRVIADYLTPIIRDALQGL